MARDTVMRAPVRGVELSAAVLCLELDCNTVFDRSAVERGRTDRRPRGPSIGGLIASTAA